MLGHKIDWYGPTFSIILGLGQTATLLYILPEYKE